LFENKEDKKSYSIISICTFFTSMLKLASVRK